MVSFLSHPDFQQYNILKIDQDEAYASNCIWVNGTVIVPSGFPKAAKTIQDAGYPIIELDMSEFQKNRWWIKLSFFKVLNISPNENLNHDF